jgi:GT2 family glycosyltransferase
MITDNDIIFKEDCIYELFKVIKTNDNIATVTPRLMYLSEPNRVYAAGTKVHFIGAAICNNRDQIMSTFGDRLEENSGGGIFLCDKDILIKSGGFDDNLLMAWGDDGELYQRLLRFGHNCFYAPAADAYHEFKPFNQKRHYRVLGQVNNRAILILTNYSLITLILLSPIFLCYEIMQIGFVLRKGYFFILIKAYFFVIKNVRYIYKKRVMIQSMRRVSDKKVLFADTIYMFDSHLKNSTDVKLFNMINSIFNWYWRKIYKFLPFILLLIGP